MGQGIAVVEEVARGGRDLADLIEPRHDRQDDVPRDLEAGIGRLDGRLEDLGERQPPGLLVGRAQARDRARHGGCERADLVFAADDLRPVVVAAVVGIGELEHVLP